MAADPDRPDDQRSTQEPSERWGLELPGLTSTPASRKRRRERSRRAGWGARRSSALRWGQATRYAGTAASNLGRSEERKAERLETRHIESALKMASVLGELKGAAMKIGQMASFIDIDFLPPEYREIYQEQLAKLRSHAPSMPWDQVREVLEEEYEDAPLERLFASFEQEASAAASIGQVHRATLHDGSQVAVKIQYPGVAEALESDLANAGILVRVAKALAPGLDAKAIASEIRERVLEELDYEFEAQNQRAFARAYEGHPSSTSPTSTRGSPGAACWSASGSRAAISSRCARCLRTNATSSGRSSSASASARSTTCSTSTRTPIRATTS